VRQSLTPVGHFLSTPMTTTAKHAIEGIVSKDVSAFPLFSGLEESYAIAQVFSKDAAIDASYSAVQAAVNAADFFGGWPGRSRPPLISRVPRPSFAWAGLFCRPGDQSHAAKAVCPAPPGTAASPRSGKSRSPLDRP
jgi:hypothetical protein